AEVGQLLHRGLPRLELGTVQVGDQLPKLVRRALADRPQTVAEQATGLLRCGDELAGGGVGLASILVRQVGPPALQLPGLSFPRSAPLPSVRQCRVPKEDRAIALAGGQ